MLQLLEMPVRTSLKEPTAWKDSPHDHTLIVQIGAGESAALALLYDRYASAVFGLAVRILGVEHTAEEVVQDTFLRVWRNSGSFKPDRGEVISWMLGIAHNLCIDELRRRKARITMVYDTDDYSLIGAMPSPHLPVDEEVWLRERREVIRDALAQLPADQRRAIELAYMRGLTQSEIAEHTGEPLGTVKTRVRLGLRKLRDILATLQMTGT